VREIAPLLAVLGLTTLMFSCYTSFVSETTKTLTTRKDKTMMTTTNSLKTALENFLASDEFPESLVKATKAGWGGSGYSVELFEDGTCRVLWDNEIGNLYESPGVILSLPKLDDDDMSEFQDNGGDESDYWYLTYENDREDLKRELREQMDRE